MFSLAEDRTQKGTELRTVIAQTLQELMDENPDVVALEADLGTASHFNKIQKSHPDQFIECGISEANMMGVAAGLSSEGLIPFVHTFGPFATRRAFDQIYLSGAYAHNTINIWGSDPGFCAGGNGGTHTTLEDVALMRTIPHAVICDAADAVQLAWIVREFTQHKGINYVRANRKAVRNVYAPGSTFKLGHGNVVRLGDDVLIVAAGQLVSDALDAAEELAHKGISAEVIDMFCMKPFDSDLLLEEVQGKRAIVAFENHAATGGLGSCVAECLCDNQINIAFRRHGVCGRFGEVGTPDYLQQAYRLTASDLVQTVLGLID